MIKIDLYIFDRELNFIGIRDSFTSLRWVRRYYKCGEFELHCDLTSENLLLLSKENIIYKRGDSEAGVIKYRKIYPKLTFVIKDQRSLYPE